MSESVNTANAYMRIAIEQRLGDLSLLVACGLTSPWTVLFGPSGAGKTSLLRVLGGLSRPQRGQLIFRGRTLLDVERKIWAPPGERGIGFVTQRPALFPHMDVTSNIAFGLHGLSRSVRQERVAQMLELFSLAQLAKRKPDLLSGGEKQRVGLARALAPGPQMLLLDEPFAGLDAPLKESILSKLTNWLQQRNIPALYVSHDVTDAFETNADVIVLRGGKVQAQGPAPVVLAGERERLLERLGEAQFDRKTGLRIS